MQKRSQDSIRQPNCSLVTRLVPFVPCLLLSTLVYAQSPAGLNQLPEKGKWVQTPPAPIGARSSANVAYSGDEIFVFGGEESNCAPANPPEFCAASPASVLKDGAAYNLNTDSWRLMSDAPIGILGSKSASIGSNLYILGWNHQAYTSPRFFHYLIAPDEWNEIELPDTLFSPGILTFNNSVLLYSTTDEYGEGEDWVLDTSALTLEALPPDPLGPGFGRQYVVHGENLYLFDKKLVPNPGGADGPSFVRGARFRNGKWSTLPASDYIGDAPVLVSDDLLIAPQLGCADGGSTNGYGRCIDLGAVFDTDSDTWKELPNVPSRGADYLRSAGGIGDENLVLYSAGKPALDARTELWFRFPTLSNDPQGNREYHAVGLYGFVFGGVSSSDGFGYVEPSNDAWIWIPETLMQ